MEQTASRAADAPEPATPATGTPEPQGDAPVSIRLAREARSSQLLLLVIRAIFMILVVTVTLLTVSSTKTIAEFGFSTIAGLVVASTAVGLLAVAIDAMTPNKRLAGVVGVYLGVCLGLVGAVAFGALLDTIAKAWEIKESVGIYLTLAKSVIGLVLCYLSVSVVLTTKDDFRLVIPYVEFVRSRRGTRPWLLDTSVLIDGRLPSLAGTGFIDAPLVVPQFVIDELQRLADSEDRSKRTRGRRGLDLLARLRENPYADLSVQSFRVSAVNVDRMLIEAARGDRLRILTLDANLVSVARIQGVTALNLNEVAGTLRPTLQPGDSLSVTVTKRGEGDRQGVGYLPDGTMIVIEEGQSRIGATVNAVVTNAVQTSAGRLVFARIEGDAPSTVASMAEAATRQGRGGRRGDDGRNAPDRT